MSGDKFWVAVVGREVRTKTREIERRVSLYGQKKVTRIVSETTEEPYVILSCGHEVRGVIFDSAGKTRQRVRCWTCELPG